MSTMVLNGERLKAIAHANPTAERTMTALALRERLRHDSDIARLRTQLVREGEQIVEADYIEFWKALHDSGMGSIVYGRQGKPTRFVWSYSLKLVAKAAIEGTDVEAAKIASQNKPKTGKKGRKSKKAAKAKSVVTHAELSTDAPEAPNHTLSPEVKEEKVEQSTAINLPRSEKVVFIPLRRDFDLTFTLPSDISKDEIEVVRNALRRMSA